MSIAYVEFQLLASAYVISGMQVISETRRKRLEMLEEEHGSLAKLNEALEWPRTDSRLSQIRNQAKHSTTGRPRVMGDDIARYIETKLGKPIGWMDTPPSYEPENRTMAHAMKIMEAMPDWQREQAIKIISAIAELPKKNGTTDH